MSECADLYAAIGRLEAKIDSLPRIDEQSLIRKAVLTTLIDPAFTGLESQVRRLQGGVSEVQSGLQTTQAGLGGLQTNVSGLERSLNATSATLGNGLDNLRSRFNGFGERVNSAVNTANQSKVAVDSLGRNVIDTQNRLGDLGSRMTSLDQKVGGALSQIQRLSDDVSGVLSKLSPLFSILGIVGAIAGLASLAGTIGVVFPRLDAHDRELDGLRQAASDNISLSGKAIAIARDAEAKANGSAAQAQDAISASRLAQTTASSAIQSANNAAYQADQAVGRANANGAKADKAILEANAASARADESIAKSNANGAKADKAILEANAASGRADQAIQTSNANSAKADKAILEANANTVKANEAIAKSNTANGKADQALGSIGGVATTAGVALTTSVTAVNIAQTALNKPVQALSISQARVEIQQQIERDFQLDPNAVRPIAIQAAKAEFDRRVKEDFKFDPTAVKAVSLPEAKQLINETIQREFKIDSNAVQSTAVAAARAETQQQIQNIQRENQSQFSQLGSRITQTAQSLGQQISNLVIPSVTASEPTVTQLEKTLQQSPTFTNVQKEIAAIKTQQGNEAKVNQEANSKLDDIVKALAPLGAGVAELTGLVNGIPGKVSQVVNRQAQPTTINSQQVRTALRPEFDQLRNQNNQTPQKTRNLLNPPLQQIQKQTSPPALQQASAKGTCQTLQPNGCMRNEFDNMGETMGKNAFPMTVPEYLSDDFMDRPTIINNQVEFFAWLVKNLDNLFGLFPIKIETTDEKGIKHNIKFENVAESFAEIFGYLSKIAFDADTAVNVGVHATAEAVGARIAALQAGDYTKAIIDYLGFQKEQDSFDVQLSCTPGATGIDGKLQESELDDFLKSSTQKVIGINCKEKDDLHSIIKRILFDSEISRSAFYKPLKAEQITGKMNITGDSIRESKKKEKEQAEKEWDKFTDRIEDQTATPFDIKIVERTTNNGTTPPVST